ncbi:hypothetical protein V500_01067 [Pseudogymnoascus sp. VKM F-4518 (FW-2643)]|nr:hypothetical protein V500_01067 [Pseudogymnoascus sp. VKM F-4518 (FW-2643)]
MQSFRRRRYQYVWAGIRRAYYGSLPRQLPTNGSHNANNVDPTSPSAESSAQVDQKNVKGPWRDLNRTTPPPIDPNQKIGKAPWRDLNRTSPLPAEGRPGEHDSDQLEVGSTASDLPGQETQLDPIVRDTSPCTPSQSITQAAPADTEGAEPSSDMPLPPPTPTRSQSTDNAAPAAPEGAQPSRCAARTHHGVLREKGRGYFSVLGPAQQDSDYGPAFAPYTTKLLKQTEGWERRPALWDISPGCFLWLPRNYKNPEDPNLLHPHPNSVNHPIVVLSVDVSGPEDAIVTFMLLRSFKSSGARMSLINFWKRHLPISRFSRENWKDEPEARESWEDALLFLENYPPVTMSHVQYVDIGSINTARWEDLHCYRSNQLVGDIPRRLCEESMARLRAARTWWEEHFDTGRGLVKWEDEWVPTRKMREVFRQRYIKPRGEEDNDLGSVVAGRVPNDVSEGSVELVLKMEGVRAEMRAEFEEARDKMRAELDKVRAETRSELMIEMLAELEDVREGLDMVNRAEKAVVELKLAQSARSPIAQAGHATSSQLAIWHYLTRKVEAMRVELKMSRLEMEEMRAEIEELRGDVDKMKVDLELVKRADEAREAARREKSAKMPDVGMYAPALGPRSEAARAALPSWAASNMLQETGKSKTKRLNEELKRAMSAQAQATQTPTQAASFPPQVSRSGPKLGPLAQSRG